MVVAVKRLPHLVHCWNLGFTLQPSFHSTCLKISYKCCFCDNGILSCSPLLNSSNLTPIIPFPLLESLLSKLFCYLVYSKGFSKDDLNVPYSLESSLIHQEELFVIHVNWTLNGALTN